MERVPQVFRVLDPAGRPWPGVTLSVVSAQGPFPELAYRTGQDGGVRIGLPPGPAVLEAIASSGTRRRFAIVASGNEGAVHELIFVPGRRVGRLVLESDEERATRLVATAAAFAPHGGDALEAAAPAIPSEEELGKRVSLRLTEAGMQIKSADAIGRTTAARGVALVEEARFGSLRHEDLHPGDIAALEAVILATSRPAWFVEDNTPDADTALAADRYWVQHINRQFLAIADASRRVAAIFKQEGGSRVQIGTGWMIGRGQLATNAHVAEHLFRQKLSGPVDPVSGWQPRPGVTGAVDFRFEHGGRSGPPFPISGHRYIENDPDGPDIAILTVSRHDDVDPPSHLAPQFDPRCGGATARALLFAIGHPVADAIADANVGIVFGEIDGTKRFSPGESRGLLGDFVLGHDCSTVNGSSGSPLIEFSSARVVGLHYWGYPGERNEAVFLPALASHPALAGLGGSG